MGCSLLISQLRCTDDDVDDTSLSAGAWGGSENEHASSTKVHKTKLCPNKSRHKYFPELKRKAFNQRRLKISGHVNKL